MIYASPLSLVNPPPSRWKSGESEGGGLLVRSCPGLAGVKVKVGGFYSWGSFEGSGTPQRDKFAISGQKSFIHDRFYWSGGAHATAHGLRISCARGGAGYRRLSSVSQSVSQLRSRGGVRRGTFRQKVENEHFLLQNRLLDEEVTSWCHFPKK